MEGVQKVVLLLVALAASGCGAMIGTPEYWQRYNDTIIRSAELRGSSVRHEEISDDDRAELEALLNKRLARK